ncbi:hypothetical protein J7K43_06150 [Candidatus Calescamantes bacterium]|nr:hypothetical protein [Candidatus Calescamantes bacterium]
MGPWTGKSLYRKGGYLIFEKIDTVLLENVKYIPHLKAKPPEDLLLLAFYPGHMKYDYQHSIDKLKPDVITDAWGNKKEALRLIKRIII